MHFTTSTLLALAGMASAQNIHVVSVSGEGDWALKFSPEKVTAAVGDMIQFQFRAGNHSVVQSNFDNPCSPIGQHANATGFFTGYQLVSASDAMGMIPTYTIMVEDEKPMWAYCSQAKHCQAGMVMVINENPTANGTRTLDNYKQLASSVPASSAGGDTSAGDAGTTTPDTDSGDDSTTGGDSTDGGSTATPSGDASGTEEGAGSASSTTSPIEQAGASMVAVTSSMGLIGLAAALFML